MNKRLKSYEVYLPRHEYWVFAVLASSPEQALKLAEGGFNLDGSQIEQLYSLSCSHCAEPKAKELLPEDESSCSRKE